ncbi:MAG: YcxB family protein [Bacteroidetes bacterium]|nr:MAG: YcxB family protein [Bacteroidota bacterium]
MDIELEFNPDHFKEIYYKDRKGNYFLSTYTKSAFGFFLISSALLFIVVYRYKDEVMYILFLCLIVLASLGAYLNAAWHLYKWKQDVKDYISSVGKYAHHRLILSDESFRLIQDQTETIVKWNAIKSVKITPEYLSITSSEDFIFPMKAIGAVRYEEVCRMVSEKVK